MHNDASFLWAGCEDWPAVEEAYNSPFFIIYAVMSFLKILLSWKDIDKKEWKDYN